MKSVIIIFILFFSIQVFSQKQIKDLNIKNNFELGQRYLKLGNSYREAKDFDKANKYLEKGLSTVQADKSWKGTYWTAVAEEYFGLLYRDLAEQSKDLNLKTISENYFKQAIDEYKKILNRPETSPEPIEMLLNQKTNLEKHLHPSKNKEFKEKTPNSDNILNKAINLENQKLKNLPEALPDEMQSLSIAWNKLQEFPSNLTNYKDLTYLDISHNSLKLLGENISDMQNIQYLDLSFNQLQSLPAGLPNLSNLKFLNLENNRLKKLPADLCEMKSLKILKLKKNKLSLNEIMLLIKCLPNTMISFDEYIPKQEEVEE